MNPNPVRRGKKLSRLLCFLACALLHGAYCYAAPVNQPFNQPSSESELLARWVNGLQYTNPKLPSYGALKIHHEGAALGDDSTRYYRVSPHNSNLGVLGLLRGNAPESQQPDSAAATFFSVLWAAYKTGVPPVADAGWLLQMLATNH